MQRTSTAAPTAGPTTPARPDDPAVVLSIPADKTLVVLVRSAASHLGSRVGLSLEELDDLRLAVTEACTLFLILDEGAPIGGPLECRFVEIGGALHIGIAAEVPPESPQSVVGFGWDLLATLVDDLRWESGGQRAVVRFSKGPVRRGPR